MFFAPPTVKAISRYSDFGSHLGIRSFSVMFLLAVVLHAGLIGVYAMMPHEKIVKVPVRVLNINLGAAMTESAPPSEQPTAGQEVYNDLPPPPPKIVEEKPAPVSQKSPQVELDKALADKKEEHDAAIKATAEHITAQRRVKEAAREKAAEERKEAADKRHAAREAAKSMSPVTPKKYVRESPLDLTSPGSNAGQLQAPATRPEDIARRYQQEISLWISRHKIYSQEDKNRRAKGDAIIRLRINGQGHVLYYVIEKSTGDAFLDHNAMAMVRASDPLPPIPENYPEEGDEHQFNIPVIFKLEE